MTLLRHAVRLVLREPRRSLATAVGVAIASALIASVLLFGAASATTVTRRALADVPVDAQVVLAAGADPSAASALAAHDPAVRGTTRFDLVHVDRASSTKSGTATETSQGVIVGLDPAYTRLTGLFTLSSGTLAPGQVAVSRDLASNLGVVPGDEITFALPGGASATLKVSGVVSIDGADLLLGPVDASHRAAGANPPANVAVMSLGDLETTVLPKVPPGATASDPSSTGTTGGGGASPVFAPDPAVRREVHVQLDHAQLPGDPAAATAWLDSVRRRVEKQGAGTFQWVDDASASLEPLAADLVWGQILFIFLALPGIALALALSRLAADATADATRRHAALLRARGATPGGLRAIFLVATALTALGGSLAGVLVGIAFALLLFPAELAAAGSIGSIVWTAVLATLLTTALASLAAILPLRAQLREEIAAGRQELQRPRPPLWQRLYLDVLAVAAGVAVFVVAGGSGIHPVLNAEGNPTVTLALTSFVAPLLLWTGGTLLLLRLINRLIHGNGWIVRSLGRGLGPGGALAGRSLIARAPAAARAIVILALAVGFATSVLVFDSTYRQQQQVDAALTLGADIKAVPAKPVTSAAARQLRLPGVAAATPFVDRVVYVGPEAQDLLAIDPTTLPSVAPLSDTFFDHESAGAALDALRARPDAILVSAETAHDYSIVPGDHVRIRVPDAQGNLRTVEFTMAGIALEFPTAPKDAFLVANQSYIAQQTGNDRISFLLARASGDVGNAATGIDRQLGPDWSVTDLNTVNARLANSITSVDLSALVLLDLVFAVAIAAVGVSLFLLAGIAERRRELATLVAVGAEPRQVRSSLVGETLVVGVAGVASGVLVGGIVGVTLLQILAGVFDPPADAPSVPVLVIAAVIGVVAVAVAVSLAVADRGLSRLSVVAALRER